MVKNEYYDKTIPDAETSLTAEDFNNADELPFKSFLNKGKLDTVDTKAMENPDMFEGDIAGLNKTTLDRLLGQANPKDDPNGVMRNAIRGTRTRWPGATIPYTISTQYSSNARSLIADAMKQFALKTCIKFIPRTTQDDYIHIKPDDGCYSYIGKNGGSQTVSLDDGCLERGIIMHELMHAVGFFHEQSRPDRDQFVEVLYENIENGFADQFAKYTLREVDYFGQPYDYYSIMHYGPRTFSKNGKETIRPIASARAKGVTLGLRNQFSNIDVNELNLIAQCARAGVVTNPSVVETTTTPRVTGSCQDAIANCATFIQLQLCTVSIIRQRCARSCKSC